MNLGKSELKVFYVNENILLIGGYVHCTYEDLGLTPAGVLPISAAFSYLIETKKRNTLVLFY